jgi:DeoR/GlpR family transcriptional regulator of sugar metabolism
VVTRTGRESQKRSRSLLAEQRPRGVVEELGRSESVSVAWLSERFNVSDMTIRRDLDALSSRNLLRKVHGGAVPVRAVDGQAAVEPYFVQKRALNRPEKQAIAMEASALIEAGDTVAFSAGTTTWTIAAGLRGEPQDLTFIINSTNIALTLHENGWRNQILLSGGSFRTPSDALVGPYADTTLGNLNADVLFLGVHDVHPKAGLTTPNIAEASTNRCLVEAAQRVVVVADSSKLGVVALAGIVPLSRADFMVTDDRAPEEALDAIRLAGVEVIVADTRA